jgi:hypothetical protein
MNEVQLVLPVETVSEELEGLVTLPTTSRLNDVQKEKSLIKKEEKHIEKLIMEGKKVLGDTGKLRQELVLKQQE